MLKGKSIGLVLCWDVFFYLYFKAVWGIFNFFFHKDCIHRFFFEDHGYFLPVCIKKRKGPESGIPEAII